MQTVNFTVYTEDDAQVEALKSVMKALKIKFEISGESPYDPDFVAKINRGKKDIEKGEGKVYTPEELRNLWK